MSTTHVTKGDVGVNVDLNYIDEVRVHVSARETYILPYCGDMRAHLTIDSGEMLDNLIEALTEARAMVNTEANRRWTQAVKEDSDSELVGSPKEEVAA